MSHDCLRSVGLALMLLGLATGAVLVPALLDLTRGTNWESVPGIVLSSTVERRVSHETDADGNRFLVERFEPRVTYRYTVSGVTQVGHDLAPHEVASVDEGWARTQAARYRPGDGVTVYHSPNGRRAALLPALSAGVWAWLALPGLALLLGVGLMRRGRGSSRGQGGRRFPTSRRAARGAR
ncbi:DUF3592 domain-containing protein [Deinococcus sp. SDU3-2]|uniref:DUF3592 domain-containing protein n=1 Tax=Deinococcus terrestris TaxID=2651870 RepID=A0A7X1NVY5_9DEIO|nr:DUF3592 domain-containing protein [Deinococcus terrestris]MPY66404.1 DUF3592 domain-containing protein [Deinococcus terrestris]